jgi:hypothetical protein
MTTRLMMEVSAIRCVIYKNTCFSNSDVRIDSIVLRMRMNFLREPTYVIYITVYVNKKYFCVCS